MKTIYCLIIFFCPHFSEGQVAKALKIGDALPVMPAGAIINYRDSSASLGDFKNPLVILDFWSTWCVPCIKVMPDLQVLQQKFNGKVQFVLATPQEKDQIKKFLTARRISLPCFVEDKTLPQYFPHNSVPHEVWIRQGVVVAITYAEEVNAENIQKILDGEKTNLVEKKSNFDYNIFQPLLVAGNGGNPNDLLYHSLITSYLDGISGGGGEMTDSANRYKIRVIDASIARLYRTAATQANQDFSLLNRTLIKGDREKILPSSDPQYTPSVREYFYSYELAIPARDKQNADRYMMEDLNRFFGSVYHTHGDIKNVKTRCWVLKRMSHFKNIAPGIGPSTIRQEGDFEVWHNAPFSNFFYTLSYINQKQEYPFVNQTGIAGNINISLPLNLSDVNALAAFLAKYRLQLSLEECTIPMLVIQTNY